MIIKNRSQWLYSEVETTERKRKVEIPRECSVSDLEPEQRSFSGRSSVREMYPEDGYTSGSDCARRTRCWTVRVSLTSAAMSSVNGGIAHVRDDRDDGDQQGLSTIALGEARLSFDGDPGVSWVSFCLQLCSACRAGGSGGHGRETEIRSETRRCKHPTATGAKLVSTPQDKAHFVRYSMTTQTLP